MAVFASDEDDALAAERLGFTEVEYAAITADDPMADWWTRFGFGADVGEAATRSGQLGHAKALCRTLGISYQELVDLLRHALGEPDARPARGAGDGRAERGRRGRPGGPTGPGRGGEARRPRRSS